MACQMAMRYSAASSNDPFCFAASCRQHRAAADEDEDDRSTIADSEPEDNPTGPSKAADLLDSGDEEETQAQFTKKPEPVAEKPRWADIIDSDDEKAVARLDISEKPRWGDLVDSDDERELHRPAAANLDMSETDIAADEDENSLHRHSSSLANCGDVTSTAQKAEASDIQLNEPFCDADSESTTWRHAGRRQREKPAWKANEQPHQNRSPEQAWKDMGLNRSPATAPSTWSQYSGKAASRGAGSDKTGAKGAGKGGKGKIGGNKAPKGRGKGNDKLQCQFIIGIEEDQQFRVIKRILGQGGENMKRIARDADAKLRLRGRGSKFLEGPQEKESTDDLMLCISSQDEVGFKNAKNLVSDLLNGIYRNYRSFCAKEGKNVPVLSVQLHEGYREGSR